ncbi:uncharacterized protein B0H18DRAFT_932440 [Fomitopsis serialis]|uniref:uncharacterized protein n=1 Tax=Fomitopsis serialis TaxID=139415 RepID=UPI0020079607|nr:uncharacterized protein B0H18DRAFT_932440 [Neoantrodia serialis]KAH9927679.1 hypothetical protein B0H18DRAFT_932440 [Neoantrodia serialis]
MPVAAPLLTSHNGERLNADNWVADDSHLVLFAYEAWGHARPLCNLASRLVQLRNASVTFFTTPAFYDRVKAELARNFDDNELLMTRIRVVALLHTGIHSLDNSVLDDSFARAFGKLVKGERLQCVQTGTIYQPTAPPKAAIIDFFGLPLLQAVRRLSIEGNPIKVFVWFAGASSIIIRLCAPERLGGIGDLRAKSEEEASQSQVDVAQAAGEIALGNKGAVIRIPGLPPMYDYEIEPQMVLGTALFGAMCLSAHEVVNACDGIILASPECYEPETTAALQKWMAETSRSVYCAGPMIASGMRAITIEKEQSEDAAEIDDFLESILRRRGERSLLYACHFISFGTVYWSMEPEKIWAFLDVVMELQIPFLMSLPSRWATVPLEVTEKVRNYADGLLTRYSPQQHVLSHAATGWFLTHGGHNSVIEAVCAGVPMICWPFSFDQPLNAIHLTKNLNVAYEIFHGRTGSGLKPVHRLGKAPEGTLDAVKEEARDVLTNAFGEGGQRKREHLQALRQRTLDARSKQGTSTRDMKAFLDTL